MILSNRKILLVLIIVMVYLVLAGVQRPDIITKQDLLVTGNLLFKYEVNRYPSSVEVINITPGENILIGMDTDTDKINFGVLPSGGSVSRRFINLTNLRNGDARISFEVRGSIEPFVDFESNNFILKGNEKTSVVSSFNSTNAGPGNYSGDIYVITERLKYDLPF